jgi:two-component system response regulator NreC
MSDSRLLIVDDHPVVLTGLRLLLANDPRFAIVGEATTAAAARAEADRLQPDLIVSDLVMGGADGIGLIEDLVAIAPAAAVLVYSSHDERLWAPRALQAGARGFVAKAEPLDTVALALATLVAGQIHVSAAVQRLIGTDLAAAQRGRGGDATTLSARELQVLRLIGEGYSLQSMGVALGLSVKTVGTYRERLKGKFGLETVRMLERIAQEHVATGNLPE